MVEKQGRGRGCEHFVNEGAEAVTQVVISDHVVSVCKECRALFEKTAAAADYGESPAKEKKRRVAAG